MKSWEEPGDEASKLGLGGRGITGCPLLCNTDVHV